MFECNFRSDNNGPLKVSVCKLSMIPMDGKQLGEYNIDVCSGEKCIFQRLLSAKSSCKCQTLDISDIEPKTPEQVRKERALPISDR